MKNSSAYLEALIREFSKLPGIGPKSASRLAFHILSLSMDEVEGLTRAIIDLKKNITTCIRCGGISDGETCAICQDPSRDGEILCVVEEPKDILTIEATGEFRGTYHVLNGIISPLDGIGPNDLNIASLVEKCGRDRIQEIILALNPTVEGDATAMYISKIISPLNVTVTRIAHGLPVGADLEYADSATIARSIEYRIKI